MKENKQTSHELGKSGEKVAIEYLKRRKYKIITKGFRLFRGEIDIITYDRKVLVFVEVKTRKSPFSSSPEESVNLSKQKQIKKIAQGYLAYNDLMDVECRFDVLAVAFDDQKGYSIRHIRDAF